MNSSYIDTTIDHDQEMHFLGVKMRKIVVWSWILFIYFQSFAHSSILPFDSLQLPPRTFGPEALAFDARGRGPYTGTGDGRILKYQDRIVGFVEFGKTSPFRTNVLCGGTNFTFPSICGRPLGLGFNFFTGDLYVADAYFGFLVLPRTGGLAIQLATQVDGVPFGFANALDIDQLTQTVYFTDSGSVFRLRNITQIIQSRDNSGKLFKYDSKTKQFQLLLSGLSGPVGVAVSQDGNYLLITELIAFRIRRFWLRGPKALTSEVLINLDGYPDNIKRTALGDFWVAVNVMKGQTVVPMGKRINGISGVVTESRDLSAQFNNVAVSEVQEYRGKLFIGSLSQNFVGKYGI